MAKDLSDLIQSYMSVLIKILQTIVILFSTIVLIKVEKLIISRWMRKIEGIKVFSSAVINLCKYITWFVGLSVFLQVVVNVDANTILATIGVGSIAITLAAQSIIKDFIMGILILIEGQFKIGDRITVKGLSGEVKSIGVRTTKLLDDNGSVHIINNSEITVLTNHSK